MSDQRCTNCIQYKPADQFTPSNPYWCLDCHRAHSAEWRAKDPERAKAAVRRSTLKKKAIVAEAKARPCTDCGGTFPAVAMDLHHRDPSQKEFGVAQFGKVGVKRLVAEITKCDPLCACCHRIRHAREQGEEI